MKQQTLTRKVFNLKKEIGAISKDSTNPFYKSKYFDINKLINQLQPLLDKYELVLYQPVVHDYQTGTDVVQSYLKCAETENETPKSEMELPDIKDPQKMGSAVTYYRRYTLTSLLGLQAEDDDGNSAKIKTQPTKELMGVNHPRFQKAVEHITNGGDISNITKQFNLTEDAQQKLNSII